MLSLSFVARKPKAIILDFSVFSLRDLGDLRVSLVIGVWESNLVVSLSNLVVSVSTSPSSLSVTFILENSVFSVGDLVLGVSEANRVVSRVSSSLSWPLFV